MAEYPEVPPPEADLQYVEKGLVTVRHNPRGFEKLAKFCPICDVPIHVRIALYPCRHFMCYDCFMVRPLECRYCDAKVARVHRPSDLRSFHSCDSCFLIFDNEEEQRTHQRWHG